MDNDLILPSMWLGFLTYMLLALIYIYHVIRDFKLLGFKNIKIIIVVGFLVLGIHCLEVIIKYYKHPKIINVEETNYLTNYPAAIGFILVALYFCLLFSKSTHFFYILAPLGYLFLANNVLFGVIPVIIFHLISIGYHVYDFAHTDYFIFATKILMCVYFIILSYIYIKQQGINNIFKIYD